MRNERFSINIVRKGTLPVVRVTPGRNFCSCGGGCGTNDAMRAYPTRLPRRIAGSVRRCTRRITHIVKLSACSHSSFLLGSGGRVFYLRTGALPNVAPADLLPRRTTIVNVDFGRLYRRLVSVSLGGCRI